MTHDKELALKMYFFASFSFTVIILNLNFQFSFRKKMFLQQKSNLTAQSSLIMTLAALIVKTIIMLGTAIVIIIF